MKKIYTLVPSSTDIHIQSSFLKPVDEDKPVKCEERLLTQSNITKRMSIFIKKNGVVYDSKKYNEVIGSLLNTKYTSDEIANSFPIALHKKEGDEKNAYFNELESPVEGQTLFSMALQGISNSSNITMRDNVCVVLPDNQIVDYKDILLQSCRDTKVFLQYIIPKSLTTVMKRFSTGNYDSPFMLVIDTKGIGLTMNLYQVIQKEEDLQEPEKEENENVSEKLDKKEEETQEEKKPEETQEEKEDKKIQDEKETQDEKTDEEKKESNEEPKENANKELEEKEKNQTEKPKSEMKKKTEFKPIIKHIYETSTSSFSDNHVREIFNAFILETIQLKFNEVFIKNKERKNEEIPQLTYYPFNKDIPFNQYFFKIDLVYDKILSAFNSYALFINGKDKLSNADPNKEKNLRHFNLIDVEILNERGRTKFVPTNIDFDIDVLYNRVNQYLNVVIEEVQKMENVILQEAVKLFNDENINFENVLNHLDVYADGDTINQNNYIKKRLFHNINLSRRCFDDKWHKGANCIMIYEVEDERVIRVGFEERYRKKSESYEKIKDELRYRQTVADMVKNDKYKSLKQEDIQDDQILNLLKIKEKVKNKEHVSVDELKEFASHYESSMHQYKELPVLKKNLKYLIDRIKTSVKESQPDVYQMIEEKFLDTEKWYEENVEAEDQKEKVSFSILKEKESNLKAELQAAERFIDEKKRIEEEKKKAEEEKKKEDEQKKEEDKKTEEQENEKPEENEEPEQKVKDEDEKDSQKSESNFFKKFFFPNKEAEKTEDDQNIEEQTKEHGEDIKSDHAPEKTEQLDEKELKQEQEISDASEQIETEKTEPEPEPSPQEAVEQKILEEKTQTVEDQQEKKKENEKDNDFDFSEELLKIQDLFKKAHDTPFDFGDGLYDVTSDEKREFEEHKKKIKKQQDSLFSKFAKKAKSKKKKSSKAIPSKDKSLQENPQSTVQERIREEL